MKIGPEFQPGCNNIYSHTARSSFHCIITTGSLHTVFTGAWCLVDTLYNLILYITVAINESLCMKNAGAQIAMDFS